MFYIYKFLFYISSRAILRKFSVKKSVSRNQKRFSRSIEFSKSLVKLQHDLEQKYSLLLSSSAELRDSLDSIIDRLPQDIRIRSDIYSQIAPDLNMSDKSDNLNDFRLIPDDYSKSK